MKSADEQAVLKMLAYLRLEGAIGATPATLAEKLGWTEGKVRTVLHNLEFTGDVKKLEDMK